MKTDMQALPLCHCFYVSNNVLNSFLKPNTYALSNSFYIHENDYEHRKTIITCFQCENFECVMV